MCIESEKKMYPNDFEPDGHSIIKYIDKNNNTTNILSFGGD